MSHSTGFILTIILELYRYKYWIQPGEILTEVKSSELTKRATQIYRFNCHTHKKKKLVNIISSLIKKGKKTLDAIIF